MLKDRLKKAREELSISQKDISKVLNCTTGKIKQIERGITQSISWDDAKKLEKEFGINELWLRKGEGEMINTLLLSTNDMYKEFDYYELEEDAIYFSHYLPINKEQMKLKVPALLTPKTKNRLEILKINSNSMDKTLKENDLVFIDRIEIKPENGKIYILWYDKQSIVCRYFKLSNKHIILKFDNPFYPEIYIEDIKDIKIIARIICKLSLENF